MIEHRLVTHTYRAIASIRAGNWLWLHIAEYRPTPEFIKIIYYSSIIFFERFCGFRGQQRKQMSGFFAKLE